VDKHVLDTIDPHVLGERLAEARRQRSLTQQQVADELRLARTTVVAIEKGDRRPRAGELVSFAQLYARSVGELTRAEGSPNRASFLVQFRALRGEGNSNAAIKRETDIKTFERLCGWYVENEGLVDAPLPRRYPPTYDVTGTSPERAAEEVAGSERNRLGLGDGPVGELWGILETDIGLRVFAIPMNDGRLAGMFVYTEEFGGCIAVNANHPEERRRWSAAHEYAHFLTNRLKPEITVLEGGRRSPESERFADAFARHFLMPSAGLQRRFESIRRSKGKPITPADVLALSHLYRVSFQAMTWRLEELRLLPSGTWERLRDQGFKLGEARNLVGLEPLKPELPRLPLRYQALAVQAFLSEQLTEGQLAERLQTDRIGARERIRALTMQSNAPELGDWRQIPLDINAALLAST
jgi:Zn-dependent peptidase ImmA (M78 family)/transcriptional regulator with XRE-family HTH domain